MATSKPSGLPQQIPGQDVPIAWQDGTGRYIVDVNWYLFLYHLWINTLSPSTGPVVLPPSVLIALADAEVGDTDAIQAYRQIANLGAFLPDPPDSLPTYRDLNNALVLALDNLPQDPGGAGGTAGTLNFTTDGTLAANSDTLIPTEKAVKTYVDTSIGGLSWKAEVRAATTAALAANTYANGVAGVGATLTATANGAIANQDGIALNALDSILVKNEAAGANNGIYVVTAVGSVILPYILTRRLDSDTATEIENATVYVNTGTVNADSAWTMTTAAPITMGTTALVWAPVTSPTGSRGKTVLTDAATVAINAGPVDSFRLLCTSAIGATRALGNPTNLSDGQVINIRIVQSSTGSNAVTYGSLYKWPGGTPPVVSTANNAVDFISCEYDATDNTLVCVMNKAFS
jgi:hypothetical protein